MPNAKATALETWIRASQELSRLRRAPLCPNPERACSHEALIAASRRLEEIAWRAYQATPSDLDAWVSP